MRVIEGPSVLCLRARIIAGARPREVVTGKMVNFCRFLRFPPSTRANLVAFRQRRESRKTTKRRRTKTIEPQKPYRRRSRRQALARRSAVTTPAAENVSTCEATAKRRLRWCGGTVFAIASSYQGISMLNCAKRKLPATSKPAAKRLCVKITSTASSARSKYAILCDVWWRRQFLLLVDQIPSPDPYLRSCTT